VETLMAAAERVVVIGGGPNGLVAAFYLAKAGFAPLVLERRETVGGVGVTEEIYPGFKCSTLLHAAGPLPAHLARDLKLESHGLQAIKTEVEAVALHPDRPALRIYEDAAKTAAELTAISARDAAKYREFVFCLRRLGQVLEPYALATPPDIDHLNIKDYLNLGKVGRNFRRLDRKDAYRLLRWAPMPIADLAAEWFEDDLLRAVIAARGIFGCFAGPKSAGTSAGLLMQAALGGRYFFVRGGVGAFTQALAKAASAAGAQIRTNSEVKHIRIIGGRTHSVVLESGEEILAQVVVSNADPRRTFLQLVDATDLDPSFLGKVRSFRASGVVAKVNLALSGLPSLPALKNSENDLSGRIHIGPNLDYLERAYDAAKYGEFSHQPVLEISIPSTKDPSLAPAGSHVMSVYAQYAPYRLKDSDWNASRDELGDAVVNTLAQYAPNIRDLIVHRQVITPLDMEQTYGFTGGHLYHGEHSLDQLFTFRPFLGWAQYRTPIQGLYLCGSGTHPGGGITGAPGANASREIIKELKSRR
jgi:phytoene dehydrogenase-like protein